MSAAIIDRPGAERPGCPSSGFVANRPSPVLRAARLAEISAETAEWIAADLEAREVRGTTSSTGAAERIRARAVAYRALARRLRESAAPAGAGSERMDDRRG